MRKSLNGFTLIELLIVVAIIAILAAIAIPNFLAAQTRSKVSRVQEELRNLGTALEAYNVDQSDYPYDVGSGLINPTHTPGYIITGLAVLTTPVAYMSKLPYDPFRIYSAIWPISISTYVYYQDGKTVPASWWVGPGRTPPEHDWIWGLWSFGPNNKSDWAEQYDPTNGVISNGDIRRFGSPSGKSH
jgi:type II secretion system protein G